MKATNIKTEQRESIWFVTAYIKDLPYQELFNSKPTDDDIKNACGRFEHNYSTLSESNNKPVKVKQHHSEI